jgi:hypothetical protein
MNGSLFDFLRDGESQKPSFLIMDLRIHLNNSKTSVDYGTLNTKLPVQAMRSRMGKSKTQLNQQKTSCDFNVSFGCFSPYVWQTSHLLI